MATPAPASGHDRSSERRALSWIAAAGLLVAAGGALAMLSPWLAGPSSDAAPEAFADHYGERRTGLLVLAYLNAVSMAVVAAVFVALRQVLGPWSPTWAGIGLGAGLLTLAMTLAGFAVLAALAFRGAQAEAARQLTDVGWLLINTAAGPPTAVSVAAYTVALAHSPYRRPWLLLVGAIVAPAHLVVAGSFSLTGPLSPTGTVAHVVPGLWFAWVASTCVVLLTSARGGPGPATPG